MDQDPCGRCWSPLWPRHFKKFNKELSVLNLRAQHVLYISIYNSFPKFALDFPDICRRMHTVTFIKNRYLLLSYTIRVFYVTKSIAYPHSPKNMILCLRTEPSISLWKKPDVYTIQYTFEPAPAMKGTIFGIVHTLLF